VHGGRVKNRSPPTTGSCPVAEKLHLLFARDTDFGDRETVILLLSRSRVRICFVYTSEDFEYSGACFNIRRKDG
jgi:hypothetical protein